MDHSIASDQSILDNEAQSGASRWSGQMIKVYASNKWESITNSYVGPIVFGRDPESGNDQCILKDPFVSRTQLRVTELAPGRVRLENLSKTNRTVLADGSILETGASCDQSSPVRLTIGQTLLDISLAEVTPDLVAGEFRTISQPLFGGQASPVALRALASLGNESSNAESLARWFETVIVVQRAAASSVEFYDQTARAIVDHVGLDCGFVLMRRGESWEPVARHTSSNFEGGTFSKTILRRVVEEKRTFFDDMKSALPTASLSDVTAIVASPIIDERTKDVIGVLYGARYRSPTRASFEIKPIEAQFVQILAQIVSMGRTRVDTEAEATRRRLQFEQFFSKDLSGELEQDPDLLEGRDREVTIMFCDIRNFSHLSENLTPRETCRLVGEVMERFTVKIRENHGVVVDYIGDGLLAMWNAPKEQQEHALNACLAAVAMQGELPALAESWKSKLTVPLAVGIGINTGMALVGNTGSLQKFKYGPLGHAVNLASRVEGATKHLGVPILITGSTKEQLGSRVANRRIGRVRVKGIVGAVELFELVTEGHSSELQLRNQAYETALGHYEKAEFSETCQTLFPLLVGRDGKYDPPSLNLAALAMNCIKNKPKQFDSVFELDAK
jgi:adenylate cyclase